MLTVELIFMINLDLLHTNLSISKHGLFVTSVLGRICALNIANKRTSIHSVPFFWTALFGKSLRYTGKMLSENADFIFFCVFNK